MSHAEGGTTAPVELAICTKSAVARQFVGTVTIAETPITLAQSYSVPSLFPRGCAPRCSPMPPPNSQFDRCHRWSCRVVFSPFAWKTASEIMVMTAALLAETSAANSCGVRWNVDDTVYDVSDAGRQLIQGFDLSFRQIDAVATRPCSVEQQTHSCRGGDICGDRLKQNQRLIVEVRREIVRLTIRTYWKSSTAATPNWASLAAAALTPGMMVLVKLFLSAWISGPCPVVSTAKKESSDCTLVPN